MTQSPQPDFLEDGRLLFAGPCDFIFASASAKDLPPPGAYEVAFAGRSNVGKSSLLNALTNRKTLARVSNTPGRTQQLARVFVLVDARRGIKPVDGEMFDLLDQAAVSYQVILTKHDELKPAERTAVVAETLEALKKRPAAYPELIFTSSQTGEGIETLRGAIAQLLYERRS